MEGAQGCLEDVHSRKRKQQVPRPRGGLGRSGSISVARAECQAGSQGSAVAQTLSPRACCRDLGFCFECDRSVGGPSQGVTDVLWLYFIDLWLRVDSEGQRQIPGDQ